MTAASSEAPRRRAYGNLRRPQGNGLLGYGAASTWIGLAGLTFAIMVMMSARAAGFGSGLPAAIVVTALTVVAVIPTRRSGRDGLTSYDRVGAKMANWLGRDSASGWQGPVGFVPDGKARLPGIAARSELLTAKTPYGEHFGVIKLAAGRQVVHYSIVLEGAATGTDLVDEWNIDQQVAHWGECLAMLGKANDVVGANVVVETSPDPGVRLATQIRDARGEDPSQFSAEVMSEIAASYPRSQAMVTTRMTVTFTNEEDALGGAKATYRSDAQMHSRLANFLPALVASARQSGAGGSCRAISAQDITDAVRVQFDPSVAEDVERARRGEGTGLTWSNAGPVRWEPTDEDVHHDRAWSTTYQMIEPPTTFYSDTLAELLKPSAEVQRKRVAFLYRPLGPDETPRAVDRDVDATRREANKKKAPERAQREHGIARAVAQEQAAGAGLTLFGLAVTATTLDESARKRMGSAVRQLTTPARLKMRPALGNQSAAYLSTLPIGVILPEHMVLPSKVHAQF